MKKAMFFTACFVFSTLAYAQQGSSATAKNAKEKEVLALQESFRLAVIQEDLKTLENMYSDDFEYINSGGKRWARKQLIDLVKDGILDHHDVHYDDLQIRSSENTAIVTGKGRASTTWKFDNKATTVDGIHAFTFIYHNKKGQWQMMAAHFSPIQK